MSLSEIKSSYLEALDLNPADDDLEFIRQLQSRHLEKFSFNNLAVVLLGDIPLDSELLCRKIVRHGRGGYCFEHNKLTYESDCLLGHFYSHQHEQAVFVNNLVVCRKNADSIRSLRNGEFHRIQGEKTEIVIIDGGSILQEILAQEFGLIINSSEAELLYNKFSRRK